jgi:hypothetical protein
MVWTGISGSVELFHAMSKVPHIKIIFSTKNKINIIRVERRYFLKKRLASFIILLLSLAIYILAP